MFGQFEHWEIKCDDSILWLKIDRKDSAVNSLNEAVLKEFDQILNSIQQNTDTKALVIYSGKKTGFIAGADIEQFKALKDATEATNLIRQGQEIFDKLAHLPFTTVAMIEGFCLGGGLELALSCDYRVALDSPKTKLGLPEVKLGIHPGWGGTVRLPQLVGPLKAMDVILTGRNLRAKVAAKMGIVDRAAPQRLIKKVVLDIINNPPKRKRNYVNEIANSTFVRPLLGKLFHHQLKGKVKKSHYPAPFRVVDNWVKNGVKDEAQLGEANSIGQLLVSDVSRNLVRVFFLSEKLKASAKSSKFKAKHVHVIGAGTMGGDIAAVCAIKGMTVTLQDRAPNLLGQAIKRAHALAKKRLKEPHLVMAAMDRLIPDNSGFGVGKADVIIEAITENLIAKQGLFKSLEENAKPEAILATNTSTIPLEQISTTLKDPSRLIGIHFFNPVDKMPLVEVVQGENSDPKVVNNGLAFIKQIDKLPLKVKSSPGFLVNRILLPYMLEAVTLLEEGVPGPMIDKAAKDFGMPMGPIELGDTVGLDICVAALEKMSENFDISVPSKLKELVDKGNLGRKTGKGFYTYKKGKKQKEKSAQSDSSAIPADIVDRLSLRLLNEAIATLREGIVSSKDELDAGCIFGFGFPPFRGGPMEYADTQGIDQIISQLENLQSRYGDRFAADSGWKQEVA